MNQKNSLGLNNCFLDIEDPIHLFKVWMEEAKKSEPNDPNAVALATSNRNNLPSVRMVLLKDFNKNGFVFYTNLDSQKGNELKSNPKAAMCFHWKSLLRQIRISGLVSMVTDEVADAYYNSRSYKSRIGAWASKQSSVLDNKQDLLDKIAKMKENLGERPSKPPFWGGFRIKPLEIEFWNDGAYRVHDRFLWKRRDLTSNWTINRLSP